MDKIHYFYVVTFFDKLIVMQCNFLLNELVLFVGHVCIDRWDNLAFSFSNTQLLGILNIPYVRSWDYEEFFLMNRKENNT